MNNKSILALGIFFIGVSVWSVFGQPPCSKIINGVGQISPGSACCINGLNAKECLEREIADDVKYTELTGVAAQAWRDSIHHRDSLARAEDLKQKEKLDAEEKLKNAGEKGNAKKTERARGLKNKHAEEEAQKRIPKDVAAGEGFKNIPFGINIDSAIKIFKLSGYRKDNESTEPFHENKYIKSSKEQLKIGIRFDESTFAKTSLNFFENKFYFFRMEIEPRFSADEFDYHKKRFGQLLIKIFSEKYGPPTNSFNPSILEVNGQDRYLALWKKENYTAYVGLYEYDAVYRIVGEVTNNSISNLATTAYEKEKNSTIKKGSSAF